MKSNRIIHTLEARNKKKGITSSHNLFKAAKYITPEFNALICPIDDFLTKLENYCNKKQIYPIDEAEIKEIKVRIEKLYEYLLREWSKAATNKEKEKMSYEFMFFSDQCSILECLYWHQYFNIELGDSIHKKLRSFLKEINKLPTNDKKKFTICYQYLLKRQMQCCALIGECYFERSFSSNSPTQLNTALTYFNEQLEITVERNENEQNEDIKTYEYFVIYTNLARMMVALGDMQTAYFHLHNLQLLYMNECKGEGTALEGYIRVAFQNYHAAIDGYIKLISVDNSMISKKRLIDAINILPGRKIDYEKYLEKVQAFANLYIKNRDLLGAILFIEILEKSKIIRFKNYAQNSRKLALQLHSTELKTYLINTFNDKYSLTTDDKYEFIKLELLTISKDSKIKSYFKHHKNKFTIEKDEKSNHYFVYIPTATTTIDFSALLDHLNTSNLAEPKIVNTKKNETKISQPNTDEYQPVGQTNESGKEEETQPKVKIKTRPQNQPDKEGKQEEQPATLKRKYFIAEELGFDSIYNHEKIYPIKPHLYPPDRYYGFYNRERYKLADITHQQLENVLEIGNVKLTSPAIKYVKHDTFKLAPKNDIRMFSVVRQTIDREDGSRSKLLEFCEKETHESQKKRLNKQG